VIWSDWRLGGRLAGRLTLTAIREGLGTYYFRGQTMAFNLRAEDIVAMEATAAGR
jgi:hypothetical protein